MPAYIAKPDGTHVRIAFPTGASARRYANCRLLPPWTIQHLDKDPWGNPWGNTLALKRHASKAFACQHTTHTEVSATS